MDQVPAVGQLIKDDNQRRDAIHVAVAPIIAAQRLPPGSHVRLTDDGRAEADHLYFGKSPNTIGIVDPFLETPVERGQQFWLFMYPQTITSLRHVWTHPVFTKLAAAAREKILG